MVAAQRATGKVKFFRTDKGYGFITADEDGEEVFVHFSEIETEGFKSLEDGEKVEYTPKFNEVKQKTQATRVTGPNGECVKGAARAVKARSPINGGLPSASFGDQNKLPANNDAYLDELNQNFGSGLAKGQTSPEQFKSPLPQLPHQLPLIDHGQFSHEQGQKTPEQMMNNVNGMVYPMIPGAYMASPFCEPNAAATGLDPSVAAMLPPYNPYPLQHSNLGYNNYF